MILEVNDLSFSYRKGKTIFKDVCFSLEKGKILSILGPNGTGKSTLLNCLSNLLNPTNGQVIIDGKPVNELSLIDVAKTIGYVQQIHVPSYDYTVRDYVVMGRSPYLGMFQKPSKDDYKIADEAIEILNIKNITNSAYTEISGGERQQASIARVIVQKPEIIMLDEPTAHLDYGNQSRTLKIIKDLALSGYAVIMTTHNPDHVILLDDYVGILNKGKFSFGEVAKIIDEKVLRELYDININLIYMENVKREICVIDSL